MKLAAVQRPPVFVFERLAILLLVVGLALALSGDTAYAFGMAHRGGGFAGGQPNHFDGHFHDGHFHPGFHGHGFHNTFVFAFGFPFAPYYAHAPYPYYYGPYCNPYLPYNYPGSCYRYRY